MNTRSKVVLSEVSALYDAAPTDMGKWMWSNHVQWVADKAKELSEKYNADTEKAYCAALLHDLGDSKYERGHPDFDTWAWEKGKEILRNAGFRHNDRKQIMEAVRTHSCHPGHLPVALEGKILSTADAMWHLQTNFFPVICYMNRPPGTSSYLKWQQWFENKIERDFEQKIFFDDEKNEVTQDYIALKHVFSRGSMNGSTW